MTKNNLDQPEDDKKETIRAKRGLRTRGIRKSGRNYAINGGRISKKVVMKSGAKKGGRVLFGLTTSVLADEALSQVTGQESVLSSLISFAKGREGEETEWTPADLRADDPDTVKCPTCDDEVGTVVDKWKSSIQNDSMMALFTNGLLKAQALCEPKKEADCCERRFAIVRKYSKGGRNAYEKASDLHIQSISSFSLVKDQLVNGIKEYESGDPLLSIFTPELQVRLMQKAKREAPTHDFPFPLSKFLSKFDYEIDLDFQTDSDGHILKLEADFLIQIPLFAKKKFEILDVLSIPYLDPLTNDRMKLTLPKTNFGVVSGDETAKMFNPEKLNIINKYGFNHIESHPVLKSSIAFSPEEKCQLSLSRSGNPLRMIKEACAPFLQKVVINTTVTQEMYKGIYYACTGDSEGIIETNCPDMSFVKTGKAEIIPPHTCQIVMISDQPGCNKKVGGHQLFNDMQANLTLNAEIEIKYEKAKIAPLPDQDHDHDHDHDHHEPQGDTAWWVAGSALSALSAAAVGITGYAGYGIYKRKRDSAAMSVLRGVAEGGRAVADLAVENREVVYKGVKWAAGPRLGKATKKTLGAISTIKDIKVLNFLCRLL